MILERDGRVIIVEFGNTALIVLINCFVISVSSIPIAPRRMTILAESFSKGAMPFHESLRNCQYLAAELCRSSFDTWPYVGRALLPRNQRRSHWSSSYRVTLRYGGDVTMRDTLPWRPEN